MSDELKAELHRILLVALATYESEGLGCADEIMDKAEADILKLIKTKFYRLNEDHSLTPLDATQMKDISVMSGLTFYKRFEDRVVELPVYRSNPLDRMSASTVILDDVLEAAKRAAGLLAPAQSSQESHSKGERGQNNAV